MAEQTQQTRRTPMTGGGPPQAPEAPAVRLFYIDNLRILLTVLVVLHHVALTYGNIPMWFYTEPAQDASGTALDLLVVFNQAFFMGFFFLISGYFVPGAHDRRGGRAFFRARLVRLGIPLLLFLVLLRPFVTAYIYLEYASEAPYWLFYIFSWDPGPMWFVETLLVFCLGYLLIERFRRPRAAEVGQATAPAPLRADTPRPLPLLLAAIGFVIGLAVLTYLWRIPVPIGTYWPVVGLPTPFFLPQYVILFGVGVLAYRRGWAERIPTWAGWAGLAAAVAAALAHVPLSGWLGEATMQPGSWQSLVDALWEQTYAVGIIVALIVLFRARVNRQGPLARFLSDNAYAVYFLHPVVLVGLGVALGGWEATAVAKFAVVGLLALALCWGAAHALRRLPGATRVF
ncbi:fucose 4-O-acetylase-like acetyltransferase [Nocardiopsis mwathae]|uniref:Fucose 4-O-acetylase-like acetyltransferase n=1 Tax=Nocardiopsis mwathae TaxID=1472723 RepID=A0A7W9YGV8_9ACTN|nr:acyltransferase family protein [Nocardiopsis mwathae]MBB6171720.1 fucose 4-O-acetylase-like acetyltransferase [Nocardiopsis mwathae]